MPDLILRDTDPDELRAAIVADVLAALRPLLNRQPEVDKQTAARAEMAQILKWSLAKLDRETAAKRIPSLLSGGRRCFEIEKVLEAVRAQTAEAELIAAARQARKHAIRKGETADAKGITVDCQGEKQTKRRVERGSKR